MLESANHPTHPRKIALIAARLAHEVLADGEAVTNLACTYFSFLHHAFHEVKSRFRNFRGYDRRWLEEIGSEDRHGRAVWGLVCFLSLLVLNQLRGRQIEVEATAGASLETRREVTVHGQ